jgi:hypothetical protein
MFVLHNDASAAYLLLYVENTILVALSTELLHHLQRCLSVEFSMKDLGPLHYFLGIAATRTADGFFLSERKYAWELLEHTNMHALEILCN